MTMEREKIKESWEKRREELCRMADQIYDWAEVGLEETKSSALLEDYLEEQGFAVEKGVGTLPTAFRATWKQGEGGPGWGSCVNTMPWKAWAMAAAIISRDLPSSGRPWRSGTGSPGKACPFPW